MPTIATVLDRHVTLQCASLDRIFLNAYPQRLQTSDSLCRFLRRDGPIPSPAQLQRRSARFVGALEGYAKERELPWILFDRRERKEEHLRPMFDAAAARGAYGLIAVGVAQERNWGWHGRKSMRGSAVRFDFSRQSVFVNQYYLYILDEDFGPSFIKYSGYAPWCGRVWLNGHEWVKRQLTKRGITFVPLDNGVRSVADPTALAELCAALGPREVEAYFARWTEALPSPLDAADRADGYRYSLSMLQVEVADTLVFDRPMRGRQFFEALLRDELALGRPSEISLLFGRRVTRATPGAFRTRIVDEHTAVRLQVEYRRATLKQYLKEGRALRTEVTFRDGYDVGVGRSLPNLRALTRIGHEINARLIERERLAEEARLDGEDLAALVRPRRDGRRVPGLRIGDERVMALLAALAQLCFQAAGFQHAQLRRSVAALLGCGLEEYSSGRMTYDLTRLRGHGLIAREERSHRYRVTARGLALATLLTKLNDRILVPVLAHATAPPSAARTGRWAAFDRAFLDLCEEAQIAA